MSTEQPVKRKHRLIIVNQTTHSRVKRYAKTLGITMRQAANKLIREALK